MGFMAGFGDAVSKGVDAEVSSRREAKAKREEDTFKYSFQNFLSNKEKLSKKEEDQAAAVSWAQSYAGMNNLPDDAVAALTDMKLAGVSDAMIDKKFSEYEFVPDAQKVDRAAAPASVDQEMAASGMVDARIEPTAPKASIPAAAPAQVADTSPMAASANASNQRIAEITGESSESVSRIQSGQSTKADAVAQKAGYTFRKKDVPVEKLTDSDIMGQYAQLSEDLAKGKDGAQDRMDFFNRVTMPAAMDAKRKLNPESPDDAVFRAFGVANDPSATPEQRREAQSTIAAGKALQDLKKPADGSGVRPAAIFLKNGEAYAGPARESVDPDTGNVVYLNERNEPIPDVVSVRFMGKEEIDATEKIMTAASGTVAKYNESMTATVSAMRSTNQIFQLLPDDSTALTFAGGKIPALVDRFAREAKGGVETLQTFFKDNQNATTEDINRAFGGSIAEAEAAIDKTLADPSISTNGRLREALESKMILAAIRLASANGTQGNGLSNKDFDNYMRMVQNSTDPVAFKKNWATIMQGNIQSVDMQAKLNNDFNPALNVHKKLYGVNPTDKTVVSITDYISQADPEVQEGYANIQKYSGMERADERAAKPTGFMGDGAAAPAVDPDTTKPEAAPTAVYKGATYTYTGTDANGQQVYRNDKGEMIRKKAK